uniref:probable RNA polymerase II nuclear localization protein SLC7A6OS n=1 Tax=Styela clava TaxID=7725 RepID=UPI001939E508|nr:probable RNA polymerase II nuclear localization protein SLC7A6OS [Styela clava]
MTSVIRVKRKRDCEPSEALLLARKKLKNDFDKEPTKSDIADVIKIEEKVFHFAGTVEPDIAHSQHVVVERVKEAIFHRNQQKEILRAGSRKRKLPKFAPFPELPKIKHLKDATIAACQSVLREKCLNFSSDNKLAVNSKKSQKQIDSRAESCEKCTIYHNDDHIPRINNVNGGNVDSIMCNNVKMFREKLNVSAKSKPESTEFVYDLYYCRDTTSNWNMSDILYVQPYRYAVGELLAASDSEEELYDDEDDSNDEDNWRNDYPDEEDDDDDSSGSSSTSEDEWDRFVQQEEEDMENDDDDLDGGNNDANDACEQFGAEQDYDYHDDLDAEAAFDYDQNDNNDQNDPNPY